VRGRSDTKMAALAPPLALPRQNISYFLDSPRTSGQPSCWHDSSCDILGTCPVPQKNFWAAEPRPSRPTAPTCQEYSNQNASHSTTALNLTTKTRSHSHIPFTTTIANHSLATLSGTGSRRKF